MIIPTIEILLIEDNPGDARLIRELLKEAESVRFAVAHAERLDAALDHILNKHFDVVLLDLGLPDVKGLDGLVTLHQVAPSMPVVVLTGLDDEETGFQAVSIGAQDYLVKGHVESRLLTRVLRYAIERKLAEDEIRSSQHLAQSTINSLNANICVLDEKGVIIAVNKSWEEYAVSNFGELAKVGIGTDYLAVCDAAKGKDAAFAAHVAAGIRAVMRGDSSIFEVEYPCHSPEENYWFLERVTPFPSSYLGKRKVVVAHENITDRVKAQATLRRQHQYLQSLQETSIDLVSELDTDQLLKNIVQRAGSIVGTSDGFLDLIDPNTGQLIPKVGLGLMKESLKFVVQPGEGLAGIVWQTGKPLVINDYDNWPGRIEGFTKNLIHAIIGVPLLSDSKVIGVLGLAHADEAVDAKFEQEAVEVMNQFARLATVAMHNADLFFRLDQELRERKQAEATLRLQGAALEAAANAIMITDAEGNIQWINPAFTFLTGYAAAESVGKNPRELIKSGMHDEALYKNMWESILAGQVWHGELINRRKDGSLYTEEQTITPLLGADGAISSFIAIKQDITERKRADNDRIRLLNQVREQAQRIRQIMDTVPLGILFMDSLGRVMLANPVAEDNLVKLTGGRGDEAVTRFGDHPLSELLALPANSKWHEVQAGGHTFVIIASPLQEALDAENWVLVIDDVTEQRTAQRYQQAQERLATLGQLAAGIAHDFNNVMGVITLYTQILQDAPDISLKNKERLGQINDQALHAANLISRILDFSRRSDMEKTAVDLLPMTKEFIKLLEHTLPESISIKLEYGQTEYMLHADPTRLQQTLMNLALNARDAMPNGGELRFALSTLALTATEASPLPDMAEGDWVHLAVSDTGTGIEPHNLPHIFDPFFTTKQVGQGTGLGLAQVYGIIKQHSGFIDVQSRVGIGTVFDIYLPLIVDQAGKRPSTTTTNNKITGTECILLVEDNLAMRLSVAEVLMGLGYEVKSVAEANGALALLQSEGNMINLILTDLVMPGMDGLELSKAVRLLYPDIKVLIMTGHSLEEGRLKTLQQTAVPWIQKPFSLQELSKKIRDVLGAASI